MLSCFVFWVLIALSIFLLGACIESKRIHNIICDELTKSRIIQSAVNCKKSGEYFDGEYTFGSKILDRISGNHNTKIIKSNKKEVKKNETF